MTRTTKTWIRAAILATVLAAGAVPGTRAGGFSFTFAWGNIPRCGTGFPGKVTNPVFTLSDVPAGTATLVFMLRDLDAPGFDHGGGTVRYQRQTVIRPGAFRYRSPCPPSGRHTYQWRITALDGNGRALAIATAEKVYP